MNNVGRSADWGHAHHGWLNSRGNVRVNGIILGAGDALKVTEESSLTIDDGRAAEVLVFDLPSTQH